MKRLLIYNACALIVVYGLWIWGWYMTEFWMRIIDTGAPWWWLAVFFISSFLALQNRVSHAALKSLGGATLTWMAFWILWFFSMPIFDPHW